MSNMRLMRDIHFFHAPNQKSFNYSLKLHSDSK
ncbi:AAEL017426-PA [Aedes aegypti]|uniref:AAEL017426-PA n=1 Tax=Aedes aegypti TaxID=7159 RepID=J9HZA5_AEDAE|nr:AAEL017426-PA [Aedes aegypti]